ncbi:hypothetical protein CSPX01_17091 [Colletotrichum filicis]|nr:hypothetical protein CSPX01_17091 [Colletotrichum filicis]
MDFHGSLLPGRSPRCLGPCLVCGVPAATATAAAAAMIQEASGPVRKTHVPLRVRQGTVRKCLHTLLPAGEGKDSYRLLSRIVIFPFTYSENITTSLFHFLDLSLNAFSNPSQEFDSRYWVPGTNHKQVCFRYPTRLLPLSLSLFSSLWVFSKETKKKTCFRCTFFFLSFLSYSLPVPVASGRDQPTLPFTIVPGHSH